MAERDTYQPRYWVKVIMSDNHTYEMKEKHLTVTQVKNNLIETLKPLEVHWQIVLMRNQKVHRVMLPSEDGMTLKSESYYANR
tara:strand:+ start:2018 stop:2266 length:249 start_codon:yes stop_codon:yes gene_type:complete